MADDAIERPADDQSDLEGRLTGAIGSLPSGWTVLGPPRRFYGGFGSGWAYIYGPAGSDPPTIMANGSPHIAIYLCLSGPRVSTPMPIPASRTTVYRHRSRDVVIEAPLTFDAAQFHGFASAVMEAPR